MNYDIFTRSILNILIIFNMTQSGIYEFIPLEALVQRIAGHNTFQRVIDETRVNIIMNGLIEEKERCGFDSIIQTGIIHIGIINNGWYFIDGQHRFSAYKRLNQPKNILVQMWTFNQLNDMVKKFQEINSNTPIEEYVLKSNLEYSQKEKYDTLVKYVEETYKSCIKTSTSPQWPNINGQQFRKLVTYITELKDTTKDTIIPKFKEFNLKCRDDMLRGVAVDRDRINKTEKDNLPRLYINRYISELWKAKSHELQ